ncbi:tectonic-like complex member MKS1 isoform X2 [Amblyomma americanum]
MDPVKALVFGSIGWTTSCPLFGVTHCSRTRCIGRVEVAHFSHPFELELERPASGGDHGGAVAGQLFLEVLSLDSWSRLRLEGYAYCDLLAVPGQQELLLRTWRPLCRSLTAHMRRFFTGGDTQLDDLVAVGPPPSASGWGEGAQERCKRLSRYAIQTESSGTVKVFLNVVRQTTYKGKGTEIARRVLGSIGRQVSQSSIAAVLASFHRARSRMLAARARHAALAEM